MRRPLVSVSGASSAWRSRSWRSSGQSFFQGKNGSNSNNSNNSSFFQSLQSQSRGFGVEDSSRAVQRPTRLQSWLQLQRELLSATSPASLGVRSPGLPESALREEGARKAARLIHGELPSGLPGAERGDASQLHMLSPSDLIHLLEDAALCPAFSAELHGPQGVISGQVFCAESSFGGCRQRRQYFRNQVMRLHLEKALLIRAGFESITSGEEDMCLGDSDAHLAFPAVLNRVRRNPSSGFGEEEASRGTELNELFQAGHSDSELPTTPSDPSTAALDDHSCSADFLIDSEHAPQLAASGKGEVFFLRRIREGEVFSLEPRLADLSEAAAPMPIACPADDAHVAEGWMLGVSEMVVAPQNSRVFLLELNVYSLGLEDVLPCVGLGEEGKKSSFLVVPMGYLPTVLSRQQEALLALCDKEGLFTPLLQHLVFGARKAMPSAEEIAEVSAATSVQRKRKVAKPPETAAFRMPLPPCPAAAPGGSNKGVQERQLNEWQLDAVQRATGPEPVTLIEGPPGTGKSEVAVAIVEAWLKEDGETPILLATGTHAAKDLLERRLRARGIVPSERRSLVLRKRQRPNVSPVFVETVYMAAMPRTRLLPRVLLDESSQITESAALVALGQGCRKLVLIGDPKQLGPVSNLGHSGLAGAAAEHAPFAEEVASFFKTLMERHGLEPLRLSVQYRMDLRLRQYPSSRWYEDSLVDSESVVEAAALAPPIPVPSGFVFREGVPGQPVVFIDTAGLACAGEELVPYCGSRSLQNRLEARLTAHLLAGLQAAGTDAKAVSVLTSYGAQRDLVARAVHGGESRGAVLRRQRSMMILLQGVDPLEDEPHPRVHTVDGFQGNENDCVVFSAVRSNELGQTGFVGDKQRLCVLLTRARRCLFVVGDSRTLQHDEEWAAWLAEANPKQTLVPSEELLRELSLELS
ncbi:unnamed protein product [Polarella glacialis]|uniref:DNA2/NAM7 helicase-like C-terminal domain-containing protein n=1 Tax=Polarella glacialis TaxID=89957 RepID=A0A813FJK7_POLGL|nr:unnamed protein product [Polarella glacialis]